MRAMPLRMQHLISENACHSDDEDAPDSVPDDLYILDMPRRNIQATAFIRDLDQFIDTTVKLSARKNIYKRIKRVPHPLTKSTSFEALPSPKVALDWHDPTAFNELPAHIRARYIKSPIALPLDTDMAGSNDWKKLSMTDEEFMTKYGNKVRALYEFPTKEEIFAMKHGVLPKEEESEESEAEGSDSEDDDGEDIDMDDNSNRGEDSEFHDEESASEEEGMPDNGDEFQEDEFQGGEQDSQMGDATDEAVEKEDL